MKSKTPISLTIAGSDSSGGAGIQADIKTFSANHVYAASVIVALTAQNTKEVRAVEFLNCDFIHNQIKTTFDDLDIDSVKIGMLGTSEIIQTVAEALIQVKAKNIVLDPVMVAKSGDRLLEEDAVDSLKKFLFPLADIITPNISEAADLLSKTEIEIANNMEDAAKDLFSLGAKTIFLKAGHLKNDTCRDVFYNGKEFHYFESKRINTKNTHGTGCSLSSAICSFLAKGESLEVSLRKSKDFITNAIYHADSIFIGNGNGPVHHFYNMW